MSPQKFLLTLAVTLLFLAPPSLYASDESLASLISERVEYLSAFEARSYVGVYKTEFAKCLSTQKEKTQQKVSRTERRQCVDLAMQHIRNLTIPNPTYQQRIINRNIYALRANGNIPNYIIYPVAGQPTLGIVGDSMAVGSMAAENLEPHMGKLLKDAAWDYGLLGQNSSPADRVSPVLRIFDTPDQQKPPLKRFAENRASNLIDCEECSFGYQIGQAMGIPPSNIFFGAQGGAGISALETQLYRIALPLGHFPNKILISFTGGDICSMSNASISPEEKYTEYLEKMRGALINALQVIPVEESTEILIVAAADVANLVQNKDILAHEVNFYWPFGPQKSKVTCEDIRNQTVQGAERLAKMCQYVLGTNTNDTQRLEHIRRLHQAVVAAQSETAESLNMMFAEKNIRFRFLDSLLALRFAGEDVSPDCFHPGSKGHKRMADSLIQELGL